VRLQKLKAGECHVMPYPAPADIEDIKADSNLAVMEQEGLNVGYLAYNTKVAPFDKAEVRKALNMAINKQAILDAVFQGSGQAAKNPIPPTMWSYNDAIEDDPTIRNWPRKMLADAGVTDLSMKIWAMPVQRPYNPNARRMAEADPGGLRQDRRRGRDRFLRMGRVPVALEGASTVTARCCSAGPATTATRTTSWPFCSAVTASAAPTARSGATTTSRL
jgi:hypothetical protein